MFTERSGKQNKLEMVILEELVPQDHLLRKIDKAIDFSFINKICKPYYCENNGRPAIEPEVLFRMLFIGYLYGIRSEIRLLKEIEINVAYRWFIGYDLTEKLPDVSVNYVTVVISPMYRLLCNIRVTVLRVILVPLKVRIPLIFKSSVISCIVAPFAYFLNASRTAGAVTESGLKN